MSIFDIDDFMDVEELDMMDTDEEEETEQQEYDSDLFGICSIEDSLAKCIDAKGEVDIYYMAWIAGSTEDEIIEFHGGRTIFQKPDEYMEHRREYEDWVLGVEYLKGNMEELLSEAEDCNNMLLAEAEENGEVSYTISGSGVKQELRFDPNIKLIKKAMPEKPNFYDIHMRLGSSWIYGNYIADFIKWLLKLIVNPKVTHADGKWYIKCHITPLDVLNSVAYGTDRMTALKIIENILNATTIKVRDEVPADNKSGKKYVVNVHETMMAQNKAQLILDKFQEWIQENPRVMEGLRKVYCSIYSYAVPHYDGSFLSLSDINPDINPYRHQRDAAFRIVMSKNTVLCHDVGSGKTFCYIMGVHELYRMGISRKNMIVVPNVTFKGTVQAHKLLYPQDKILEISPDDFKPGEKTEYIEKIMNGDYVAIYIAYSKFDMIGMSYEYMKLELDKEIKESVARSRSAVTIWERDLYHSKIARLEKRRTKLFKDYDEKISKNNIEDIFMDCFDKLGITLLCVDECQNYKNISIDTRLENIVGMHHAGSKKADLMMDKVRCVQQNGGRIIFATGTLITNSMSDMYVFQTYLQPDVMESCSIATFGEWANTFGSITTNFEVDVNSQNYRYMSRISHYHNLPELMAIFTDVCDFYHIDQEEVNLPLFAGFKDIPVKSTKYHKAFNEELVERTDEVRKGVVSVKVDNVLKIITDGRKAALDIRLINEQAVLEEMECKAGLCAKEAAEIYYAYPGTSQVIFCDYSTPKNGFNVYDEVKKYLILRGIPEKEIAFIHDGTSEAKRNKLLNDLDEGVIRIMVGSTQKLGVGVNVQKHLIAIHHLDAPWRPSDLTQREGRLIRQGNENKEVFQYRYITEQSFDAYVWQILENKQRFIGSFLAGSMSEFHRDETDVDEIQLDCAEVKAIAVGNPAIKERIVTANKLERYRIAQKHRAKQLFDLREKLRQLPIDIKNQNYKIVVVKTDQRHYKESKESMNKADREAFGEELLLALSDNTGYDKERLFDTYMGFEVYLPAYMTVDKPHVILSRAGGGRYKVDMKDKKPVACTQALDGTLIGFENRIEKLNKGLDVLSAQLEDAKEELEKGNPYDDLIEEAKEKLEELDKLLEEESNTED